LFGILVIDKPLGITSHDVVNRVRRRLGTKRVGHAGTLDPLATGVLVMAIGPATRFLQYLSLEPKVYEFTARFGVETRTQDAEGEVVAERTVPEDLAAQVEALLPEFRGEICQLPPMYSAVKKDGKPLYTYARKGEEIERTPREITVFEFEITAVNGPDVSLRCVCSGGTYVRTLAHDLGQRVGCGAHLIALRRTHVGDFTLDQAADVDSESLGEQLVRLNDALNSMQLVTVPPEVEERIRQGQRVPIRPVPVGPRVGLVGSGDRVFGVATIVNGSLHPECLVPSEVEHGSV